MKNHLNSQKRRRMNDWIHQAKWTKFFSPLNWHWNARVNKLKREQVEVDQQTIRGRWIWTWLKCSRIWSLEYCWQTQNRQTWQFVSRECGPKRWTLAYQCKRETKKVNNNNDHKYTCNEERNVVFQAILIKSFFCGFHSGRINSKTNICWRSSNAVYERVVACMKEDKSVQKRKQTHFLWIRWSRFHWFPCFPNAFS